MHQKGAYKVLDNFPQPFAAFVPTPWKKQDVDIEYKIQNILLKTNEVIEVRREIKCICTFF